MYLLVEINYYYYYYYYNLYLASIDDDKVPKCSSRSYLCKQNIINF